jgi:hypothetical protein
MRISVILEINNHLLKICAVIQPTLTKETAGTDVTYSGYEIPFERGVDVDVYNGYSRTWRILQRLRTGRINPTRNMLRCLH